MSPIEQTTLIQGLYHSVIKDGLHVAIVQDERRINYNELWKMIGSVQKILQNNHIQKGDRVALYMENSAEYIACYYGIQSVGAVSVPLNTHSAINEINNYIKHSSSKILFIDTNKKHLDFTPEITVIDIDQEKLKIYSQNVNEFKFYKINNENELASIIYTSGTTGHPKGVMLSHKNLVTNTNAIIKYRELNQDERVLNLLPFYYSYGNSVLHSHLRVGATLVLENSIAFPHKILSLFEIEKITSFPAVSTMFSLFFNAKNITEYNFSTLKTITQAGGFVSSNTIQQLFEIFPNINIFLMYGQTEATARLTYLPSNLTKIKINSVGVAIENVQLQIRDTNQKELPANEIGEIYAKGPNIMLGYLNDSEATNKVLIDGWLKTGDQGKIDTDGFLYIIGRNSEFIKTGANRVNPLEVEEIISELEEVKEVAVFGKTNELLGQSIEAAVVLKENKSISILSIKAHCREKLPLYKIPKNIYFLKELPKTTTGKIKRTQLAKEL